MLPHEPELSLPVSRRIRILHGLIIIVALTAVILAILGSPWLYSFFWSSQASDHSQVFAQKATATPSPFQPTTTVAATAASTETINALQPFEVNGETSLDGLMVVSLSELGYSQLFSHQLLGQPFTRLTQGAWDDIHPALSPDGEQIAFTSNRSGNWDLYLLDFSTGQTVQLSDDAEYDGHPSWSPDGAWLAYEHYADGDIEIFMRPIDGSVDPVRISAGNGADYAPAWRPGTQQIAFVSDRGGSPQIWLVDLEAEGDARFQKLVETVNLQNSPAWSPDGNMLTWSQQDIEVWTIYAQDLSDPDSSARRLGPGISPKWNEAGNAVLALLRGPNETYLTAYTLTGGLALAPEWIPGSLDGVTWGAGHLPDPLPNPISAVAQATSSADLADALASAATSNTTIALIDLNAPFEEINGAALIPFEALRQRTSQLLGWDALSELQNVFVPIDQPLPPARQHDWLYTGRAFELHSGLLSTGWMALVREDFNGQTFWRVFLRAADDSGGPGRPLIERPWDLSARFSGTESDYQDGGELMDMLPSGYWLDFTALAADFGFERVPALGNWRSYYQGALFNLFVLRAGLSWEEAMLQLYSPEEMATIAP